MGKWGQQIWFLDFQLLQAEIVFYICFSPSPRNYKAYLVYHWVMPVTMYSFICVYVCIYYITNTQEQSSQFLFVLELHVLMFRLTPSSMLRDYSWLKVLGTIWNTQEWTWFGQMKASTLPSTNTCPTSHKLK